MTSSYDVLRCTTKIGEKEPKCDPKCYDETQNDTTRSDYDAKVTTVVTTDLLLLLLYDTTLATRVTSIATFVFSREIRTPRMPLALANA